MFSENQKISVRQMTRLLVYDMIGISTLMLPAFLAKLLGQDGIFALLLALLPAFLVVWFLERSVAGSWKDFGAHMRRMPLWLRIPVLVFYICEGVLTAGYGVYLLGDLVLQHLLPDETYWLVVFILILLGGYGIWRGIEGRARVYEILFWILMAPLLLMLLLAAKDVDTWYWTPVFSHDLWSLLRGTGIVFLFYLIVIFAFFLTPYLQDSRQVGNGCRKSLLIAAGVNGAVYLVLLGNFGTGALAEMPYAVIDLMSMVKLPGGFFERQDAFMVAIWFFTLYAFINTDMFYASDILRFLAKGRAAGTGQDKTDEKEGQQEAVQSEKILQFWTVAAVMALTFGVAAVLYLSMQWREYFYYFQMWAGAPLFILILLGLQWGGRRTDHEA
ncbi:MAG: spore germination protein [Lachnospiraceae bacterium]|nr:spore germination protein [Lachnospiraceae bacterium]